MALSLGSVHIIRSSPFDCRPSFGGQQAMAPYNHANVHAAIIDRFHHDTTYGSQRRSRGVPAAGCPSRLFVPFVLWAYSTNVSYTIRWSCFCLLYTSLARGHLVASGPIPVCHLLVQSTSYVLFPFTCIHPHTSIRSQETIEAERSTQGNHLLI